MMNQTFGAAALGVLMAASSSAVAHASVPLPVIQLASGVPSLAPVLKKITPAVVSIAVTNRTTNGAAAPPRKASCARPCCAINSAISSATT